MKKKVIFLSCENGNIMLMALMILLVLSVLGTAIVSVAGMERKISNYSYNKEQAQQAADAGIEWAIESIYYDLKGNYYSDPPDSSELPVPSFLGGNITRDISINIGATTLECTLGLDSKSVNGSSFQYVITSQSSFVNSKSKKIRATINYSYNTRIKEDGFGSYTLCTDSPENRGIVSYTLVPGT